jgi:hypothetical protein
MLQDQDFQVSRTTVASPESEQAGRDLHDEVEEKEHRGMVEEPLVEDRIRVSDPYGGPDDVFDCPPGHDGYTIGDEPAVMIEWSGLRTSSAP